jgi:hypothetical protein
MNYRHPISGRGCERLSLGRPQFAPSFAPSIRSVDKIIVVAETTRPTNPVGETLLQFARRQPGRHAARGSIWLTSVLNNTLHCYLLLGIEVQIKNISACPRCKGSIVALGFRGALDGDPLLSAKAWTYDP